MVKCARVCGALTRSRFIWVCACVRARVDRDRYPLCAPDAYYYVYARV